MVRYISTGFQLYCAASCGASCLHVLLKTHRFLTHNLERRNGGGRITGSEQTPGLSSLCGFNPGWTQRSGLTCSRRNEQSFNVYLLFLGAKSTSCHTSTDLSGCAAFFLWPSFASACGLLVYKKCWQEVNKKRSCWSCNLCQLNFSF